MSSHPQTAWQKQNEQEWQKLGFVLEGRTSPVVLWITCDSYRHLLQIFREFQQHYPDHLHLEVRLDDFKGGSITVFLEERLPEEETSEPASHKMLHLFGIEKHLGIWEPDEQKSKFFQALNFERELFFSHFPFPVIFWSERYSQIKAQQLAPDFWDWLTYKFYFEAPHISPSSSEKFQFITDEYPKSTGENRDALFHRIGRLLHELDLLESAPGYNPRDKLALLKSLADTWYYLQEFSKALNCTRKILENEELLSLAEKAHYLNFSGLLHQYAGNHESAMSSFQQSLKIHREIGDRKGEGESLSNIGQLFRERGDFDAALQHFQQSLQIQQEIGDRPGEGATLNNISPVYQQRGDYDTALRYLQHSLQIRQEIGDRMGEGVTLNNIGQIFQDRGDYDTALRYLQQSLQIRQEIGDHMGEGATLNNIGLIYKERNDYEAALRYLQQSVEVSRKIGNEIGMAIVLHNMGMILLNQDKVEDAAKSLLQAYQIFYRVGSPNAKETEHSLYKVKKQIGEARFRELSGE